MKVTISYEKTFKRSIDFLISLFLIVLFLPLLLFLTVLLFFANRWNPFFVQTRPGRNGNPFKLLKFKTMKDTKDTNGELLHDKERLTKVGKIVRALSLDELPQLFNVLFGDMSLIGPRPLLMEYLPLYNEKQSRRHEVKPGITGWSQVNGRKDITFSKRFELDVWYVDNLSLSIDMKIFWLTIKKIISRENNPAGNLSIDVDDVGFREKLGIKKSKVL